MYFRPKKVNEALGRILSKLATCKDVGRGTIKMEKIISEKAYFIIAITTAFIAVFVSLGYGSGISVAGGAIACGIISLGSFISASLLRRDRVEKNKLVVAEGIQIVDADGNVRASLGVGGIQIIGEEGKMRAFLGITQNGGAGLSLWDMNQKIRGALYIYKGGFSGLTFSDADGEMRAGLGERADGSVFLRFLDDKEPRAGIGVKKEGTSEIVLWDKDKKIIFHAP